jgi:branched-chain amino acid transport system permease protein
LLLYQLIISGVAQGAIYALVALSLTVVYRGTTIVNFGHGDLVMAGAFVAYVFVVLYGVPFIAAALLALVLLFGLGIAIERGLIEPIKTGPHISFAMMSIAVGYVLRGIARAEWGREVLPMPRVFDIPPIFIGNVVLTGDAIAFIVVVAAFLAVFFAVLYWSTTGQIVQAVYQSERGASLIGINVRSFHAAIWGVGASMGAVAGLLLAPVTLLYPDLGANFLIRGFAAMTLGGFGSLWGAVVGGLLLGVAEQLLGGYVSTKLIDIAAYLVIIAVLVLRPTGLFGRAVVIRV